MKKRRVRWSGNDSQNLTPEDREAMRTYRANRKSPSYYRDLDEINAGAKPASQVDTTKEGTDK